MTRDEFHNKLPDTIYLVVTEDDEYDDIDIKDAVWCAEDIYDEGFAYVRRDKLDRVLADRDSLREGRLQALIELRTAEESLAYVDEQLAAARKQVPMRYEAWLETKVLALQERCADQYDTGFMSGLSYLSQFLDEQERDRKAANARRGWFGLFRGSVNWRFWERKSRP